MDSLIHLQLLQFDGWICCSSDFCQELVSRTPHFCYLGILLSDHHGCAFLRILYHDFLLDMTQWHFIFDFKLIHRLISANGKKVEAKYTRKIRRPRGAYPWIFRALVIDLFSLYILFSHFRPRDTLMGICLLFFHWLCVHLHVHKTTFERNYSLESHHVVWNGKTKHTSWKGLFTVLF